jgi:hypothetical protein
MSFGAAIQLARMISNVREPVELDYGEGIILWQASQVFDLKSAFRPLEQYPHIVFHYTPLYHMVVNLVSRSLRDLVLSGRLVSMIATVWLVGLLTWVILKVTRGYAPVTVRWFAGAFTCAWALLVPAMQWVPWARVDMLGLALQFTALILLIAGRPRLPDQIAAFGLLLLGVYTKQTLLSIPAASIALMGLIRPVRAIWLTLALAVAGLGVLLAFVLATDGMVLRHWILYNVNPFHLKQALTLEAEFSRNLALLVGMGLGAAFLCAPRPRGAQWSDYFRMVSLRLRRSPMRRAGVGFGLVVVFGFLISWGVGKEGANINYCLDWQLALCPLAGIFLVFFLRRWTRDVREMSLLRPVLLAALLATAFNVSIQSAIDANNAAGWSGSAREKRLKERAEQAALVKLISSFPGPVVSENMTLLLKAGKSVPFEPAIVKVDSDAGIFDERPLDNRIASRFFDAFILYTGTGRLTPGMKDAISSNYHSTIFPGGTYTVYVRNQP